MVGRPRAGQRSAACQRAAHIRAQAADAFDPASVLKILIASDTHLGYAEKDQKRGNDSFDAFEEIFTIAKEQQVAPARAASPGAPRPRARARGAGGPGAARRRPLP